MPVNLWDPEIRSLLKTLYESIYTRAEHLSNSAPDNCNSVAFYKVVIKLVVEEMRLSAKQQELYNNLSKE